MCKDKKVVFTKLVEAVGKLPYKNFELDSDYNLSAMVCLETFGNNDIALYIIMCRNNKIEINMVPYVLYHKIKSFLVEEPRDNKVVTKYHCGVTSDDMYTYLQSYINNHNLSLKQLETPKFNLAGILEKYYQYDYFYAKQDNDFKEPTIYIDNGRDSYFVQQVEGSYNEVEFS